MDTFEVIQRLAIALAIGFIIGLERGWRQRLDAEGDRAAGLRTHALSGLLGGAWGAVARASGEWGGAALGFAFLAFAATIAVFRLREMAHDKTFGATTMVAAMMAFSLGALAMVGDPVAAAAAGVATATLLALKAVLHAWLKHLTWEELRAGLVLLAMSVILLPILPNRGLGPWEALNPFAIWFMTILIATLSFAGYIAVRLAGARLGVLLSGLAGGLVSSTAVTLNMADLAREHPERRWLFVAAIALANAVMLARVLAVAGALNAGLLPWIAPPLVLAALVQAAGAGVLARWSASNEPVSPRLALDNPFDLAMVLKFGALLTAIMFLAKALTVWAGADSTLALAAISGVADVDAISLSMAKLGGTDIPSKTAAFAILIAAAINSMAKAVLAWWTGGAALARPLLLAMGSALAAGMLGLWAALSLGVPLSP